ncbi:MAG: polyphosphate kinase 2 family protein, partial [Bacteroidia bacterium]|nr:polyphosphate kinase 2 family protein [Bacteroidia bacterium]
MKKVKTEDFKIIEKVNIADLPTSYDLDASKSLIESELRVLSKKLGALQNTMYAHAKYAVLMCIQGMDTA